ncbi:hypothetical protein EVG20_g8963 [Dentipellis fragilis]|uniref:F-box domain-containing protein n=1 Tax=Dentipellis fragilis TaxID=205917 RepID=A0A4Y9Y252_9AGAM|nr:hypothetical protein EVG20_g8963 [Dentipellis fragilis]
MRVPSWTAVFFGSRQLWKEFIVRSQNAPLYVVLDIDGNPDTQAVQSIVYNLHRIRRLLVHGAQIFDVFPCGSDRRNLTKVDDMVLYSLFGGRLPRLKQLSLTRIPGIRANSHLFAETLTSLELHGCDNETPLGRLPLADLIGVLTRLPLLETLHLEDIFADPVSSSLLNESLADIPLAHVAHLHSLVTVTTFPFIHKALTTHLCTPNLTRLSATVAAETVDEVVLPPLISWTQDPTSLLALYVLAVPECLDICGGPTDPLDNRGEGPPFNFSVESAQADLSEAVFSLCAQLPLRLVQSFRFSYIPPVAWTPVLLEMNPVEELETNLLCWKDLLQILTVPIALDNGPARLPCPRLKKLKFTTFAHWPGSDVFFEALAIAVELRQESGFEMDEIHAGEEIIPCRNAEEIADLRNRGKRYIPYLQRRVLRRLTFK